MTINGLENNYYLSGNDIWASVGGFAEPISIVELVVKNLTSNLELLPFKFAPSPTNNIRFNISQIIRALQPERNHINLNSLQEFEFKFTAKFVNSEIEQQIEIFTRYFVNGGRDKDGNDEWYLNPSEELIVGKWIDYGIALPGFAKRIQGSSIVDYVPTSSRTYSKKLNNCDYRILKFRNTLGGYQYFLFEKFENKTKTKPGKTIPTITDRLRKNNFKNLPNSNERTIEFFDKTSFEIQQVFTELVKSDEVYLFNNFGSDNDAKFELLQQESNDSVENNYDRTYENKITFSFSNYITKSV